MIIAPWGWATRVQFTYSALDSRRTVYTWRPGRGGGAWRGATVESSLLVTSPPIRARAFVSPPPLRHLKKDELTWACSPRQNVLVKTSSSALVSCSAPLPLATSTPRRPHASRAYLHTYILTYSHTCLLACLCCPHASQTPCTPLQSPQGPGSRVPAQSAEWPVPQ